MNWSEIKNLLYPQVTDSMRSWRTLAMLSLFLAGGLYYNTERGAINSAARGETHRYSVAVAGGAGGLAQAFMTPRFEVLSIPADQALAQVRQGKLDVFLEVLPPLSDNEQAQSRELPVVKMHFDEGRTGSVTMCNHVQSVLDGFREKLRQQRMAPRKIAERFDIVWHRPSAVEERGKQRSSDSLIQAQSIIMWTAFTVSWFSGMFAAAMMVEERKEGCLILLLISPVSKSSVIAAFLLFSVVATASMTLIGLCLGAPALMSVSVPPAQTGIVPPMVFPFFFFWICLLPHILLTCSVGIFCSTFIRHRWQPSVIDGLMGFVAAALCSAVYLPMHALPEWIFAVPMAGCSVNMLNALLGTFDAGKIILTYLLNGASAYVFLLGAYRRMTGDAVLKGEVSQW